MLPPEEWNELRAEIRVTHSEIARLNASGESPEAEQYQQEKLERLTRMLAEHNDGSDPWAPLGGLDVRFGPFFLIGAVMAFQSSQRRRERWLYFSLASNAALCVGVAMVLDAFSSSTHSILHHYFDCLTLGGIALGIAAAGVLRIERMARCQFYASQRALALPAAIGAASCNEPIAAIPESVASNELPPVTGQALPPVAAPPLPVAQSVTLGR